MNSKTPLRPPKDRIFQVDELQQYKEMDVIRSIDDVDEDYARSLGEGFSAIKKQGQAVIINLKLIRGIFRK